MEANLQIIVALLVAALGGGNVLHVVIIVLLGLGLSPERIVGVVSNRSRIVSVARRARGCMRGAHFASFVSGVSRWHEGPFEDAIEWTREL